MSRIYRLNLEVEARGGSADERAEVALLAYQQFRGTPEEWDYQEDGATLLVFDGETTLCGGQGPSEAHEEMQKELGWRGVRTKWWFLEGDPDFEYYTGGAGESGAAT